MDHLGYLIVGVGLGWLSYVIIDSWNRAGEVLDEILKEWNDQSKHRGASGR